MSGIQINLAYPTLTKRGPGSLVGIATGYGLDDPGIDSRWGRDFSAPVQTGPGAHPVSCTMGTGSHESVAEGFECSSEMLYPIDW